MIDAVPGINNAQTSMTQLAGGVVVRPTEKQEEAQGTRIGEHEEADASKFEKSEEDLRLQALEYAIRNQFKEMLAEQVVRYTIYNDKSEGYIIRLTHLEEGTIRTISQADLIEQMAEQGGHFIDANS